MANSYRQGFSTGLASGLSGSLAATAARKREQEAMEAQMMFQKELMKMKSDLDLQTNLETLAVQADSQLQRDQFKALADQQSQATKLQSDLLKSYYDTMIKRSVMGTSKNNVGMSSVLPGPPMISPDFLGQGGSGIPMFDPSGMSATPDVTAGTMLGLPMGTTPTGGGSAPSSGGQRSGGRRRGSRGGRGRGGSNSAAPPPQTQNGSQRASAGGEAPENIEKYYNKERNAAAQANPNKAGRVGESFKGVDRDTYIKLKKAGRSSREAFDQAAPKGSWNPFPETKKTKDKRY